MKLLERSFSSKIFRPRPKVHLEEDGSLLVVATSWGQPEYADKVIDEIIKYVNAAKSDVEVTSPFEFLEALTDEANYVRIATCIANDALYRIENKMEYHSGVEVMVLLHRSSQLAWAQVGSPSLLIKRENQSLQPLSLGLDLSAENLDHSGTNPPLPSDLLGLERTCRIQSGHAHVQSGDQLVLFSGSLVGAKLWSSNFNKLELASVSNCLIQENSDSPFWLGLVEI